MKPDHSAGAGMSRAAKKRAKKNNKKNDMTRDPVETEQAQSKKAKLAEKNEDPKLLKNSDEVSESDIDREMGMSRVEKEQERTTFVSGDSPSGIPSLPNSSLTDILMLTKGTDEASNKIIEELASTERAACLLQAILYPTTLDQFYSEYWEKKPLLARCSQKNKHRFSNLLSLQCIRKMSKREHLFYARDLNVTRYQKDKNGVKRRITLDKSPPDGSDNEVQVDTSELWSNYDNGCTIRLLCPHKQSDEVHALLSTLELELQCMVGANAYLTPPNSSQGFAPHYDDIEAFCLQLEGKKRWKVYEPTLKLPRVSSEDFTTQELEGVQPVLDIVLEEGDLLYMPRGWIHQACTIKDDNEHSLHLTVSAMQQWAWIDLLDVIVPEALENAAMDETSSTLREGLPRGFLEYMGVMYEEPTDEKLPESLKNAYDDDGNEERKFRRMLREKFRADVKKKLMKVNKTVSVGHNYYCIKVLFNLSAH